VGHSSTIVAVLGLNFLVYIVNKGSLPKYLGFLIG
jgi:hypothetical protein